MRWVAAFILPMTLMFSLTFSLEAFDNNKDNYDRVKREFIPYNDENIDSGRLKGGHDTFTAEAMLLKEKVHKQTDPDGGTHFVEEFSSKALPSLRMGTHDEDTNEWLNWYLKDPPIGSNGWGNFFEHFYTPFEPGLGSGLKYWWNPATERAKDYTAAIRRLWCKSLKQPLTGEEAKKLYDYLGRVLHLMQDMGNPAHTRDDIHIFTKTFEDYVKDNWKEIVNRDWFRASVNPEQYREGDYASFNMWIPEKYIESLADVSSKYPTDGLWKLSQEQVETNARALIPMIIKMTAGYIDNVYEQISGPSATGITPKECENPPRPTNPSGDHPDDRFDVSDEFYWEKEFGLTDADLTDLFLRTATKKGKIGVWYKKQFMETFFEGRAKYLDADAETKVALESKFEAIKHKLEERKNESQSDWKGAPDVALFANGFYDPSISLMLKIGEPVSFQDINFNPNIVEDHPVLLIPTGGFYGLENSEMVKAALEEYVRNGGTLVVLAQQHGYDWTLLPTPADPATGERKPITGYGYQEDQSCHFDSVYIDTYHPILSGFSTSTATIGVDGYFTSYPQQSTILLRRTASGQPAMILYPFGAGYVLATTIYSDFALTHHQANQSEVNLVQSIISWAKQPTQIVEIKPGEVAGINLDLSNFTDSDAAAIKVRILDPSRTMIYEETRPLRLGAGQSTGIPVSYVSSLNSPLGIYHIDYILLDPQGNVIQPQAETDSGRFIVSNPPTTAYQPSKTYQLWVTSPAEYVLSGTHVTFTIHIKNNTQESLIGAKVGIGSHEARSEGGQWWIFREAIEGIDIPAGGQVDIPWTFRIDISQSIYFGLFRSTHHPDTYFLRGGLALAEKGIRLIIPSLNATLATDKPNYVKGETLRIDATLENRIGYAWQPTLKITIKDARSSKIFEDTRVIELAPDGSTSVDASFTLPSISITGNYTINGEIWYGGRILSTSYTRFDLLQSQISVSPNLPSFFSRGTNSVTFTITNSGRVNVSSGILDFNLQTPDGRNLHSGGQPFEIAVGETKILDIPISIPFLQLGRYVLSYTQSDETKRGNPTYITVLNSIEMTDLSSDKPLYRIRETASFNTTIKNTGKFNLEDLLVTVSAPGVSFSESQTISLGVDQSLSLRFPIPIPDTISAGYHDVSVTVSLFGDFSTTWHAGIFVPASSLSVRYEGPTTFSAGDTIEMIVENSGGVDTDYEARIYLSDQNNKFFVSPDAFGFIQTGAQVPLRYSLPDQLTDGTYSLRVELTDEKTNKIGSKYVSLSVAGLSGELSVRTDKDIYFSNEETMTFSSIVNHGKPIVDGNLHLEIVCAETASSSSSLPASFHIFGEEEDGWVEHGVLHFPSYFDRQELHLSISPDPWGNALLRIRHEGTQQALLDYIALRGSDGAYYPPWFVGIPERRNYTSGAVVEDGLPAEVTGENVYVFWESLPSGISYQLVMTALEESLCGIIWQMDTTIHQGAGVTENLILSADNIGFPGKFYLRGELTNSLGQRLATSSRPFYIIQGETALLFHTDKRIYKVGEAITITGQIENRAPIVAENLVFTLNTSQRGQIPKPVFTDTIHLAAGGVHPFTVTTLGEEEGILTLSGTVKQNNQTLVSITDQFEVALPGVHAMVTTPDLVGNETFTIEVAMHNNGNVDGIIQLGIEGPELADAQTITISPGETRILQYSQQISKNETYTFIFAGDYEERMTKMVSYGLGASIEFGIGSASLEIFPEGSLGVPITITNTGQLAETLEINFSLTPGDIMQRKTYFLAHGTSISDILYFELTEGDYQITTTGQRPDIFAQANFSVRKADQVDILLSMNTYTDGLLPVQIVLTNVGFNEIRGSLNLAVMTSRGQAIWSAEEPISPLSPQSTQFVNLLINPSAIEPGDYTLRAQVLNNSNEAISVRSQEFRVRSATFEIAQLPSYQTFTAGGEATFSFRIRNTGDQEGEFDLRFKSHDLTDSVQREWLKPGEEKTISFTFDLPEDLEEKDYFGSYELRDVSAQETVVSKGQVRYHLAGINLNVRASLDKPYYSEGETAHLTLDIQSSNPGSHSLFARVNYPGYESSRPFTLAGNQTLLFDVPLAQIKGDKLFFGVYHESGRSLHLNSLYIHRAGETLTIVTDKQVYQPGETVSLSVRGSVSGAMILSGPGSYEESFSFSGEVTKTFVLPSIMTAGTYFIYAELRTENSELIRANHPIDAAGIQVKVLECKNDKRKYAASDMVTTSLVISSNQSMEALIKAWIFNPEGKYDLVGEKLFNLSSGENSLLTIQSPLVTTRSGIHRLTYGIYSGDLLLVSGSEAFDVGETVLLGLSADKMDYSNPNEPVHAKVEMFGTTSATLNLLLDGEPAASLPVSLSGWSNIRLPLPPVSPGAHTLKATLSSGELTSTQETTFLFGTGLPDLAVYIHTDHIVRESNLRLNLSVFNLGRTDGGATNLYLFDGMITPERFLTAFDVRSLGAKESVTFTYMLDATGRTGANTLYAVIDPDNLVHEFNEINNVNQITLTTPALTLSTYLDKEVYPVGDSLIIIGLITNLSNEPLTNLTVTTTIEDTSNVIVFRDSQPITLLNGMTTLRIDTSWQSDPNLPEGAYTIHQTIQGTEVETEKTLLLKLEEDFEFLPTSANQRIELGETARYTLTLTPLRGFPQEVSLSISGCPEGFTASFDPNPISLSSGAVQTVLELIPTGMVKSGSYAINVNASGGSISRELTLLLDVTDFQVTLAPESQTVRQLNKATYTISLMPMNNFEGKVRLGTTGVPKGMRINLSADQAWPPQDIIFTVETSKWLLPGEYEITIIASSKVTSHTATARLVVLRNPHLLPGIVTTPGLLYNTMIHTFLFDGAPVDEFQAFDSRTTANVAVGDVDGDGMDEIVVGTSWKLNRSPAIIEIFKKDGNSMFLVETEYRSRFGLSVAVGDIDGDWVEEIAIGFYAYPDNKEKEEIDFNECNKFPQHCYHVSRGTGGVRIFKLIGEKLVDTGAIVYPYEAEHYRGTPNIALGDVDGDGLPELITAPGPDPCAPAKIKVFKISNHHQVGEWRMTSVLTEFYVNFDEQKTRFGANIATGDIDGDGKTEIIVGAGPDSRNPPIVQVYRGDGIFTGTQFAAYPDVKLEKILHHQIVHKITSGVYVATGDMENDGISEIITGMGPGPLNEAWVRIFRGDGTPIGKGFLAYPENMKFGVKVSSGNVGE